MLHTPRPAPTFRVKPATHALSLCWCPAATASPLSGSRRFLPAVPGPPLSVCRSRPRSPASASAGHRDVSASGLARPAALRVRHRNPMNRYGPGRAPPDEATGHTGPAIQVSRSQGTLHWAAKGGCGWSPALPGLCRWTASSRAALLTGGWISPRSFRCRPCGRISFAQARAESGGGDRGAHRRCVRRFARVLWCPAGPRTVASAVVPSCVSFGTLPRVEVIPARDLPPSTTPVEGAVISCGTRWHDQDENSTPPTAREEYPVLPGRCLRNMSGLGAARGLDQSACTGSPPGPCFSVLRAYVKYRSPVRHRHHPQDAKALIFPPQLVAAQAKSCIPCSSASPHAPRAQCTRSTTPHP